MTNYKRYSKVVVAMGSTVVAVAATLGFHIDPTLITTIEGVVASLLVYVVPNGQ